MLPKPIVIVECPSNLGLKAPRPGHEPGVKRLPQWLHSHGLYNALNPAAVHSLLPPAYSGDPDPETGIRNADSILSFAKTQANLVEKIVGPDLFTLVIGGDCSILIGQALALKRMGRYGLFFLDGHTDYSWPGLSETGGAAGMDFAIVTGRGAEKLTNIDNRKPYFLPQDCWNAGNRCYDPAYTGPMEKSGIPYWNLERLRKEGLQNTTREFLDHVEKEKLDGFWIHMDADVLHDDIMPAVDSPAPDGLRYDEWKEILGPLLSHPKALGMELTIIDPELDPGGVYTVPFVKEMSGLFAQVI